MMRGAHPPEEEMQRRSDTIIGVIDGSARIAEVTGTVESIGLRRTIIRDECGMADS